MKTTFKIQGFKELKDALRGLQDDARKKVVTKAVRAAAVPIQAEAKALAPVLKTPDARRKPGTLQRSIKITSLRDSSLDGAAVKVHVKKLSGKAVAAFKSKTGGASTDNPDDPFYARFVEYGTSKMTAKPFLRPAFAAQRDNAIAIMRQEIRNGLDTEARKRFRKVK